MSGFYRLKGPEGMSAVITDYGAALAALWVPDARGQLRDLVLGYDRVSDYEANTCFLGAVMGRNANRIGGAQFSLHGKRYVLEANQGANNLHSGPAGFDRKLWRVAQKGDSSIRLCYHSPDGDQGFPGDLDVAVTYSFGLDHDFRIHYEALSQEDTLINLTNHTYFNLNGQGQGDILTHRLQLEADEFTPIRDAGAIPTGEIRSVEGSALDFRQAKEMGRDIEAREDQPFFGQGYDHNFVLRGWKMASQVTAGGLWKAAQVYSPTSGIGLEVYTDRPGLQFYSGNHIYPHSGKGGALYRQHSGFCLETQCFPDAIHQSAFPSPVQKGGCVWTSDTRWKFIFPRRDP